MNKGDAVTVTFGTKPVVAEVDHVRSDGRVVVRIDLRDASPIFTSYAIDEISEEKP